MPLLILAAAATSHAQSPASAPDTTSCLARSSVVAAAPSAPRADSTAPRRTSADSSASPLSVVIYAAASASEVKFTGQPELRVRLCGGLDSVHVVERRNLPSPVVSGTTYRDVYVAVEIFGRLNADCITAALTRTARDSTARSGPCASLELNTNRAVKRPPVR